VTAPKSTCRLSRDLIIQKIPAFFEMVVS